MVVTDLPRQFAKEMKIIGSTHGLSSSIIALDAHGFGQVPSLETILKSLIFLHRLETKGVGRRH